MNYIRSFLLCGFFLALPADASVLINGTRVIYSENAKQKTIQLSNNNTWPVLVQTWVDDGDLSKAPDEITVPFTLTPPLFKMEPHEGQSVRISWDGTPLSPDRESIFYLNVLEIPPVPKDAQDNGTNQLRLAIRNRIKLLFRPKGVGMPEKIDEKLAFSVVYQGELPFIKVKNSSPWYISFRDLTVTPDGRSISLPPETLTPFGEVSIKLPYSSLQRGKGINEIKYSVINDWGGVGEFKSTIR